MASTLRAHPLRIVALLVLLLAAAMSAIAPDIRAAETDNPQALSAIEWLRGQQTSGGGFAAFGDESDPGTTADVVYALVAAGIHPDTVTSDTGASPVDYLVATAADVTGTPGLAGKVALALLAAGVDPADAGGVDLIAAIQDGVDPDTGFFGFGAVNHSFAMLALIAAGVDVDDAAVDVLLASQIEDGSWSFTGDTEPGTGDSNSTAMAVQALAAVGGEREAIDAGIDFILSLQDDTGAIAYDSSEAPNIVGDANSTAVAIQAILASGGDASAQVSTLETFQNESGAFFWRGDFADDSLLATAQAVPAILGEYLPLEALPAESGEPVDPGTGNALDEAMQPADPLPGCTFVEVTSHNLCGSFAEFWTVNGGLAIFGYPLTEEFIDADGRTVQYFERARFELHPENAGTPYEVLLGRIGAEQLDHAAGN